VIEQLIEECRELAEAVHRYSEIQIISKKNGRYLVQAGDCNDHYNRSETTTDSVITSLIEIKEELTKKLQSKLSDRVKEVEKAQEKLLRYKQLVNRLV
jgi:Zn-finger protein